MSRTAEIAEAREAYLQGPRPGRVKSAVMGALRGFGQGLATGQGLGAGLGGAVAGAGFGAISPRGLMETQFAERIKPRILERFAMENEDRAAMMSAEDRALANEERRARIANMNRQNQPQPQKLQETPIGMVNPISGEVITPFPAKAPEPRLITFEGRTYDYNDPAQRAALEQAQNKLPRDKFGRFISRSDERVTSRASRGEVSGARNQRQMSQAASGIAAIEKLAREAMESPESARGPIFNQMRAAIGSLQAQFPDLVEVGEHNGWPFARLRPGSAPAARATSTRRAEAKKKLIANGYSSAEADSELDRLGIQ
jgi:hypothetical protein